MKTISLRKRAQTILLAAVVVVLGASAVWQPSVTRTGLSMSATSAQAQARPLGRITAFVFSMIDTYDEKGRFLGQVPRNRITLPSQGLPFYRRRGAFIEVELLGRKVWIKQTQVRTAQVGHPRTIGRHYRRPAPRDDSTTARPGHTPTLSHARSSSSTRRAAPPAPTAPPPPRSYPITKAPSAPPVIPSTPRAAPEPKRYEYRAARPPVAQPSPPPAAAVQPPSTGEALREERDQAERERAAASERRARSRSAAPRSPEGTTAVGGIGTDPNKDWDVMPVFYGTDRGRKDGGKRIEYTSDRAKRLDLGRALVTIPKSHQVPNIERPWALKVLGYTVYQESEDPKRHFTISELRNMGRDAFLNLVRERLRASDEFKDHALVFIHGYNNGFDDALYRTAQIAYDLQFDGAPFMYSWPSGAGLLTYGNDQDSAKLAETYLREFLELVTKDSGAKKVSIIAHSMGNRPLLEVLREFKRTSPEGVKISQVIFAAPDVDRDVFEAIGRDIKGVGEGMTLLVSSNDVAMSLSRRLAGGTIARAGDVPPEGPLIVGGIDTIDVSGISTDILAAHHNTYAESKELLEDLRKLIKTGVRPPHVRQTAYQRMPTPTGDYWRWRPSQQ